MIKIRAFRAIKDIDTCYEYIEGHKKVLTDYGITSLTSATPTWVNNPNVFLLVAELTESKEVVGGIRVQIADGTLPLPIETAIGHMDERIYTLIEHYRLNGGVGEVCGLWNSKRIAGKGISVLLSRASVAIVEKLSFETLVCICAEHTYPMFSKLGFLINNSLGLNGGFAYPNPNYVTHVLGILNAETLDTTDKYDRERILSLRKAYNQIRIEEGAKGEMEIEYQLDLQE